MKKRTLLAIFTAFTLTCSAAGFASCNVGGNVTSSPITSDSASDSASDSSSESSESEYAYELETTFYSNDAQADMTAYLKLKKDGTAEMSFDDSYKHNGENVKIADGTWTKDENGEPSRVILDDFDMNVDPESGTIQVYCTLNQNGLLIAEENSAMFTMVFRYRADATGNDLLR
jgi:hypothetical protein